MLDLNKILYFAYGSNLNINQILHRCPNSVFVKKYDLKGFKLIFDTYASIEYTGDKTDVVKGVIYELTIEDEEALDIYEGVVKQSYFKTYLKVGKNYIMTYIKNISNRNKLSNPTDVYMNKILEGYRFWNLDNTNLLKVKTVKSVPLDYSKDKRIQTLNYYKNR